MKLIKGLLIIALLLVVAITIYSETREEDTIESGPIINSSLDPLTVSCDFTREDLLKGLTAYDAEDGYITDSIIPGSFSLFKEKGVSEIDYYVYDSDNNCGRIKRNVVFFDYSSPKIALSSPLVFYTKVASNRVVMNSLYGIDCLDGDVKHIKVNSSTIDYATAGTYTISVSLINSFGDTATYDLPVHIITREYSGLEIRLTENLIYIKTGTEFNPEDFVKEVELSRTEKLMPQKDWGIKIKSDVDTSTPGVYEVRYRIRKENNADYGSVSGTTWLTVIVED